MGDEVSKALVRNITDSSALLLSKIQPATILTFYLNCKNRWKRPAKRRRVKPTKEVCASVLQAMQQMIRPSYDNLPRIQNGRQIVVYVDVRNDILVQPCYKNANLSCMDAMVISILSLLNAYENAQEVAICYTTSQKFATLDVKPSDNLVAVKHKIKEVECALLDLCRPISWASENKRNYDTFVFLTGTHTYSDTRRLYKTVSTYQTEIKSQTRCLVAAFGGIAPSGPFSVAKPNEKMYHIVGFDGSIPKLIINFINQEF